MKYEIYCSELNKYPDTMGKDTYYEVKLWGGSTIVSALWNFLVLRRNHQHIKLYCHQ
jgi:hypothetical protein